MSETLITLLSLAGSSFVTAAITWIFARKKNKAEAKQAEAQADISELDVVEKAIAIWRKAAEDLLVEVERLRKENKHLVYELAKVRKTSELIISLLQKISPENAQRIVDELSKINNNDENQ